MSIKTTVEVDLDTILCARDSGLRAHKDQPYV